MNPKKYTFSVRSRKLGFMVSHREIEVDLKKIKAIVEMKLPKTEKKKKNSMIFREDTIHKQVHSLAHHDM